MAHAIETVVDKPFGRPLAAAADVPAKTLRYPPNRLRFQFHKNPPGSKPARLFPLASLYLLRWIRTSLVQVACRMTMSDGAAGIQGQSL